MSSLEDQRIMTVERQTVGRQSSRRDQLRTINSEFLNKTSIWTSEQPITVCFLKLVFPTFAFTGLIGRMIEVFFAKISTFRVRVGMVSVRRTCILYSPSNGF
jgi:hypothetical protein